MKKENSSMESKNIIEINGGSHSGSSGRSTPNNSADASPGKLFVGGLSWQTSCERLREYFMDFGNVTDVLIMKDPQTQRSRGFGFITFSDPSSVENVLKVQGHSLDGKKIDPKHATPKNRPRGNKTKKIFVGGVSQDTSSEEIRVYFSQFGKVDESVMLMDQQTKRHRGFGFVTFEDENVVDTVCEIHYHMIKNKKVEAKRAQPKEVVAASAPLLGKRLMIGHFGMRLHNPAAMGALAQNPLVMAQAQAQAHAHAHAHAHAAAAAHAAAQAQSVAVANSYGKIFGAYPPLSSYRFNPYGIPTVQAVQTMQAVPTVPTVPAVPAGVSAAPAPPAPNAPGAPIPPPVVGNPYQGYNLANVDMSSFQGVDWSSMYGNQGGNPFL